MKAFKKEIYWQCDLMAIKKSNVTCVHSKILANMTQVSHVAPGPLVRIKIGSPVGSYGFQVSVKTAVHV
jgi:hypothetical protein